MHFAGLFVMTLMFLFCTIIPVLSSAIPSVGPDTIAQHPEIDPELLVILVAKEHPSSAFSSVTATPASISKSKATKLPSTSAHTSFASTFHATRSKFWFIPVASVTGALTFAL